MAVDMIVLLAGMIEREGRNGPSAGGGVAAGIGQEVAVW
jgi:hypothetical protein